MFASFSCFGRRQSSQGKLLHFSFCFNNNNKNNNINNDTNIKIWYFAKFESRFVQVLEQENTSICIYLQLEHKRAVTNFTFITSHWKCSLYNLLDRLDHI